MGVLYPGTDIRWPSLIYLPEVYPDTMILVHWVKLFSASSPLYGKIRWQRDQEPPYKISIHGFEDSYSEQDFKRVLKWLRAYRRQSASGRLLGTGTYRNAAEFRKAASDAVATVRLRDVAVTPQAVAELLTASGIRRFRRWLTLDFGHV